MIKYLSILILAFCLLSNFAVASTASGTTEPKPEPEPEAESMGSLSINYGLDYSTGYFGRSQATDILFLPISVKYNRYPWRHKITLPWIQMNAPSGTLSSVDGGVLAFKSTNNSVAGNKKTHPNNPRQKVQGLGDITIATTYELNSMVNLPFFVDIGAKLKIPTADESKGLGTGEFDLSINFDFEKTFMIKGVNRLTLYSQIGYKNYQDTSTIDFNNTIFYSVGFDYNLSPSFVAGISYDYKAKVIDSGEALSESLIYLNWKVNKTWSLNSYLIKGFSTASPDKGVGLQLIHQI